MQEAKRYIVTGLSENQNGYDLTLTEYAEDIYNDSEIKDIKPRPSSIIGAPPAVLAGQRINEMQSAIDELIKNTSPRETDRIASQVFDREFEENIDEAVGEKTPVYRGVYRKASDIERDTDGGLFNLNDWIVYMGENSHPWRNGYVYQRNPAGWDERPKPGDDPTYGWLYLDAVASPDNSMADGFPDGMFSNVFCKSLTAATAFIKYLFMQQATIRENGYIRSEETDGGGNPLLLINKDGIKAVAAILKDSIVQGTLLAGDAWDINGNPNPNSYINGGALFRQRPKNPLDGDYGSLIFNASLRGDTTLGQPLIRGTCTTFIYGGRVISDKASLSMHEDRRIVGEYTAAELWGLLDGAGHGGIYNDFFFAPLNGVIMYDNGLQAQAHQSVMCHVNAITWLNYYTEIQGADQSMRNIAGRMSSNHIEVRDGNTTLFTVYGSTKIKVNFIIL